MEDGELVDQETGSLWDITRGLTIDGELEGQLLLPIPGLTAFERAWFDFYPDSEVYGP